MFTAQPHLDENQLRELQELMGEDFSLLIDTYLQDSEARIESLAAAIESAEPAEIARAAHSFKGASANIGAVRLTELCKGLEYKGRQGILRDLLVDYQLICQELQEVTSQLTALR